MPRILHGRYFRVSRGYKQMQKFLETHDFIMNADVRALCNVSAATANRILTGLGADGKLTKCRKGGHWTYK